ncbi:hypothetical protein QUB28_15270 [Microcoleus sp. B4-C3]
MKVQVLSVQPAISPNTREVLLSVGTDTHKFLLPEAVAALGLRSKAVFDP